MSEAASFFLFNHLLGEASNDKERAILNYNTSLQILSIMKTLKTLSITLAILLVAGVFSADAQQRGQRSGAVQGGILAPQMTEALQLTDQQRLQILDLRNSGAIERQAMRATFQEGDTTPNEMRSAVESMRERHQDGLRQILTEEQYAKLETLREERRELNQSERSGNRGGYGMMQGGNRQGMMQGERRRDGAGVQRGNRDGEGAGIQRGMRQQDDTFQRGRRAPQE